MVTLTFKSFAIGKPASKPASKPVQRVAITPQTDLIPPSAAPLPSITKSDVVMISKQSSTASSTTVSNSILQNIFGEKSSQNTTATNKISAVPTEVSSTKSKVPVVSKPVNVSVSKPAAGLFSFLQPSVGPTVAPIAVTKVIAPLTSKTSSPAASSPAAPFAKTTSNTAAKASPLVNAPAVAKAAPVGKAAPVVTVAPVVKVTQVVKPTPVVNTTLVVKASPVAKTSPVVKATPVAKASSVTATSVPVRPVANIYNSSKLVVKKASTDKK